jgi:hypothetical protein
MEIYRGAKVTLSNLLSSVYHNLDIPFTSTFFKTFKMHFNTVPIFSSLLCLASASPLLGLISASAVSTSIVAQFPEGTWLENLAVRSNEAILVTVLTPSPSVYQVSPSGLHEPILLTTIPESLALLGIAETSPDVFAVVSNNYSTTTGAVAPGSNAIWEVDVSSVPHKKGLTTKSVEHSTKVRRAALLKDAQFLNGLDFLPGTTKVLTADSAPGVIYVVDMKTGSSEAIIDDDLLRSVDGAESPIGVNGVRVQDDKLYFSNSGQQLIGTVKINKSTGQPKGHVQVFDRTGTFLDDFAIAPKALLKKHEVFAGTNRGNSVIRVRKDDSGLVTDAGSLAGTTSVVFARKAGLLTKTTYASTSKGLVVKIDVTDLL